MRHHLDGLAQVVALALAVDDSLVYAAGGDAVVACGVDTREALVVTEVKVGLKTVVRDVALAVLVGVQGARVDVDVGVEFLNSDLIAASLQQAADAGGDDALTQRRDHSARDEDILCVHNYDKKI